MQLNMWQKNLLSGLIIAVGGFILFNIAFILAAVTRQGCSLIVRIFYRNNDFSISQIYWKYVLALIIICISWFIFNSKLTTLMKATYLTMPLMVLLILEGIRFYQQPKYVSIGIGTIFLSAVTLYLYQKKLSWQYYFATIYTGVLALFILMADVDI